MHRADTILDSLSFNESSSGTIAMALERRGNRQYLYEKQRIGRKVVSRYVAKGELAECLAHYDQFMRQRSNERKREARAREREQQAEFQEIDRKLSDSQQRVEVFLLAVLIANGYHEHKGQWRKQRGYDSQEGR